MQFSATDTQSRYPTVVRHQGVAIVLAMDEDGDIDYRVLALNPAQPDDDKSWSDRHKLSFPNQLRPAGMSLLTVDVKPNTAERTADTPFQALSDGKHVYLFRQSTHGTLYVDRFVFDAAAQTLNPAWEARFQRSRKRDVPASRKDTLGARDMEGEPFFEPTTELAVVNGLQDGRFSVLLLPGRLPSEWRWQIFVTNPEGEIDSLSIGRGEDGLFDMADVQRSHFKWADARERFQAGPAALLYMQQEEAQDEYGRPQRVKRAARVMLAAPVGSSRYALELDGVDDYVSLGNRAGLQIGGAITIEAWLELKTVEGMQNIVAHGAGGVYLRVQDGQYQIGVGDRRASYAIPEEDTDSWIHLAGVYDPGRGVWLLFRNGSQVARKADPMGMAAVDQVWAIGGSFAGQINNVRLWNVARTEQEILQNMHRRLAGDETGLVGYWPIDEGTGDTIHDQASQNHGHIHVGYCLEIDGTDDYVSIPNHDNINFGKDNNFTVTVWAKTAPEQRDTTLVDNMIVEKWSGEGGYPYVIRYLNRTSGRDAGKIVVARYDGSNNPSILSNTVVNDGRFHHLAFTKEGPTLCLYIDGLLEGTTNDTTTDTTANDSPLYVGVRGGLPHPLSGQVNHLRIWDRALSSEEIREDMDKPAREVQGAVGNWAFDEGSGDTIHNRASEHHGQLHIGHSLKFDGLDDHVVLPYMNPDYTNGLTVEAWVRYRSFQPWSRIIDMGNGAPGDNIFFANRGHTNDLTFEVHRGVHSSGAVTAPGALETNTWMHLAATVDWHGNAMLYKNGRWLASGTMRLPNSLPRRKNYVGRSNWAWDGYFDGDIGEVCLWNVARTRDEILQDIEDPPASDEPGLVSHWLFGEGAGDTIHDRACGHHGQLRVGNAQNSHALFVDGVDDYVHMEDFAWPAGGPVTVEFWAKVNSSDVRNSSAFTVGALDNPNRFHVHLPWGGGDLNWDYGKVDGEGRVAVDYDPYLGRWTHVALVSEGNNGKWMGVYLNGELIVSKPSSDGPKVPLRGLWIGKWELAGMHKGHIADFRIWNRVRSQNEIKADMHERLTGDEDGLVGYWPLDEGEGDTIHDQTTEAHHGQLHAGPEDKPDEKWTEGPDNPNDKWEEGPEDPNDKWQEGPEDANDKWVVVPPIAILDFGISRDGTLAWVGDKGDGSEITLALSGKGDRSEVTVARSGDHDPEPLSIPVVQSGAGGSPVPVVQAEATVLQKKLADMPMPTIAVDRKGLTVSAGLLDFAHTGDRPFLLDGADGLVHLYSRGDYGQFLVAQYDTLTARAEYALPLDGTGATEDGPRLHFTARRPGMQMDSYEIAIVDGSDGHTCQVTIDGLSGIREAWQNVPRDLESFLAVLNGTATNDANDPLVQEGKLVSYDYCSLVQREGVPDLTSTDNPFFGSTLFAVGADSLPDGDVPITVRNAEATEFARQPGRDCAWIPEPQGKALQFNGADNDITLPHDSLAITGDLALEAWVKVTAGSSGRLRLINHNSESARFALGLVKDEGEGYKVFAACEDKAAQTTGALASPEEWTHVAAVYNATNALKLDGQGYIDCGNDVTFDMAGAMTVEAWVTSEKESGARLQPEAILSKWGAAEEEQSWRLYIDTDGRPCFETRDGHRVAMRVKASVPVAANRPYHLAAAFDASPKEETALEFDGVKNCVRLGNPEGLQIDGSITIEGWIRVQASDGLRNIVAHGYDDNPRGEVFLRIHGGQYEIGSWNGRDHKTSYPIPQQDVDTWVHLAGVYDSEQEAWILYRNGIEVSRTQESTGAVPVRDVGWAIGARGTGAERFFKGQINNVRICDRALSAEEIRAGMDEPALHVAGTVGHWAFDVEDKHAAADGKVRDRSDDANDGTLEGGLNADSFVGVDKCRYEQKIWVNGDAQGWRYVTVDGDKGPGHLASSRLTPSDTRMILGLGLGGKVNVGDCLLLQDEQVVVKQVSPALVGYELVVDRAVNGITREHRFGTEVFFLKRGANEIALTTTKVNMGRSASDTGYFQGIVDDVRLWDVGRRDWQIQYYRDQPLPGDAEGLVGDWRFEEARGRTAIDSKGSNHGRLVHPESSQIERMWTPAARNATLTVYVNGRPVPLSNQNAEVGDYGGYGTTDQFTIGAMITPAGDGVTSQQHMSGCIDEVRVWNQVRSPEQIRDNMYRALSGAEEGLAGYWPLDEGEGTAIRDQTGNGQDGILRGPLWVDSTAPIGNEGPEVTNVYGGLPKPGFGKQIAGPPVAVEYGDMQWDDEGNLFGVMKRCYIFEQGGSVAIQLVTGFKVGDLELNFIGQVQTAPTLIGYIEGAPPVPSENLTVNDPVTDDYVGTSSIQLTEAKETTQVYSASRDTGFDMSVDLKAGVHWAYAVSAGGLFVESEVFSSEGKAGLHAYFEHSMGYLSTASKTAGTSKTLTKSLNLGGSWEEAHDYDQNGQPRYLNPAVGRRYLPNNMGYALVKSGTADLYALRIKRTGSLVAFQVLPNPDIPEDWNIIMFPLNPNYVKNGTLDGMVGLVADPDYPGAIVGGRGSYFKPLEAYALKEQIEREVKKIEGYYGSFAAVAKVGTGEDELLSELPGGELGYEWETGTDRRSMANTYVWTADGGFYAEEEQFSSIRQESRGSSYHFLGQGGLYADVKLAAGLGFFFEVDALFGGHINTTVSKSKEEKAAFGLHVDLKGEGFLNRWEGDPGRQLGCYTAEPCPGKVDAYRFMTFYLAPKPQNFDTFFEDIVDPDWLNGQGKYAGEYGPNARALREALSKPNEVWRVLHRVTYVSRIPPRLESAPVEARPKDVRRPANIEANMGLIQEVERLLAPRPGESRLVTVGRAADELLLGDDPELVGALPWWADIHPDTREQIRQDVMEYLTGYYEIDPSQPDTEPAPGPEERRRVTAGLQALYTFEEGEGMAVHDVSGVGTPLDLTIERPAAITWTVGGLEVTGESLVASQSPASRLIQAIRASRQITVEAWIKPSRADHDGLARIVTLSAHPGSRNVFLGQRLGRYHARLRTTASDETASSQPLAAGTVSVDGLSHLVYTCFQAADGVGEARLYLNGKRVGQRRVMGGLSNWDDECRLGLGREFSVEQRHAWAGTFHLVAIYNRALTPAEVKQNYDFGADTNLPPVVHAWVEDPVIGPTQQAVISKAAHASLGGMVRDDRLPRPPAAITTEWTKVDGPGNVQFESAQSLHTTASFDRSGRYDLRLSADDGALQACDEVAVQVIDNRPPDVDAGPDQAIKIIDQAILDGAVEDDGLPDPPGRVTLRWTQDAGPAEVTIEDAATDYTVARFKEKGKYRLRLTACDGHLEGSDDVTVVVNAPPQVEAGTDQRIKLGQEVELAGEITDNGLGDPPGTIAVAWRLISEGMQAAIAHPNQPRTKAALPHAGNYTFELTVDNGYFSASDTVTIRVWRGEGE